MYVFQSIFKNANFTFAGSFYSVSDLVRENRKENWSHLNIRLRSDGSGVASQPVAGGEEEVGWLGHPVLPGPHRLDVPHQQPVEDGVEQQHAHATGHG